MQIGLSNNHQAVDPPSPCAHPRDAQRCSDPRFLHKLNLASPVTAYPVRLPVTERMLKRCRCWSPRLNRSSAEVATSGHQTSVQRLDCLGPIAQAPIRASLEQQPEPRPQPWRRTE